MLMFDNKIYLGHSFDQILSKIAKNLKFKEKNKYFSLKNFLSIEIFATKKKTKIRHQKNKSETLQK